MSRYLVKSDLMPKTSFPTYPMWTILDREFGTSPFGSRDIARIFGELGWRKEEVERDFGSLLRSGFVERVRRSYGFIGRR